MDYERMWNDLKTKLELRIRVYENAIEDANNQGDEKKAKIMTQRCFGLLFTKLWIDDLENFYAHGGIVKPIRKAKKENDLR